MRLTATFDKERIWEKGNSVRYLIVRVSAEDVAASGRAALNLALVVDASGSMAGERLRCAVQAAHKVVDCLNDQDCLSVVSFDDNMTDHLVRARMNDAGKVRAQTALARMAPGGSTNLCGGWLRGAEHVAEEMAAGSGWQNRVIVLSDGFANCGTVYPPALAEHARQLAARGLYSSTVGIGDDYASETLEAIALHGGGMHHRAGQPHEIVEVVNAELGNLRQTVAEDMRLLLTHAPGVRIQCLNDLPMEHDGTESRCTLGSLGSGATRTVVFKCKFPPGAAHSPSRIGADLTWRVPGATDPAGLPTAWASAAYATSADNKSETPKRELAEEAAQMWQANIVRRVVRLNRENRYQEAAHVLDKELRLFSKYAVHAPGGSRLLAELENLRRVASQALNEGVRKDVENIMFRRRLSVDNVRSAPPPANWTDLLPGSDRP